MSKDTSYTGKADGVSSFLIDFTVAEARIDAVDAPRVLVQVPKSLGATYHSPFSTSVALIVLKLVQA